MSTGAMLCLIITLAAAIVLVAVADSDRLFSLALVLAAVGTVSRAVSDSDTGGTTTKKPPP